MNVLIIAALLYPSILKTDNNLFKEEMWKQNIDLVANSNYEWSKSKGGPFSEGETVWKVSSHIPVSSFWRQDIKLKTGHKYLVGAWVRRDMARAIIWCWSKTESGKPYINVTPFIQSVLREHFKSRIDISISHCKDYATAVVLVE